jgi:hypothetical protein
MRLHIGAFKQYDLGIKATVAVARDDEQKEVYRGEVKLWQADSRNKFIAGAIKAANGHLTDIERARLRSEWDEELRKADTEIKAKLDQGRDQTETTPSQDPMTEEEREAALILLKDPALLFTLLTTMKELGIVGEEANLLTMYIVMTSRLLQRPLSAAIKGESSTGKSALDETVRRFFPENEAFYFWSAQSKQALIYSDRNYENKMLVFAESLGADDAAFYIRTILSEHRLVFEVTERDEATGKSVTRRIEKKGPTGFVTTTTLPHLHPENETRLITLAIDESEAQTTAIKQAIADEYEWGLVGVDFRPWINAQRLLSPVDVQINYASYLLNRLPNKPVRMRRDCRKLLTFIAASAALHQFQRERIATGAVIANLADYYNAKILFEDIFFQSLYSMHPNTMALMSMIRWLSGDPRTSEITTDELMFQLKWPKSKISKWAKPLHDYGWITNQGRGKEYLYHVGRVIDVYRDSLPSIEEMAEKFPDLAEDFVVVHPLTGDSVRLQKEENEDRQGDWPVGIEKDAF